MQKKTLLVKNRNHRSLFHKNAFFFKTPRAFISVVLRSLLVSPTQSAQALCRRHDNAKCDWQKDERVQYAEGNHKEDCLEECLHQVCLHADQTHHAENCRKAALRERNESE